MLPPVVVRVSIRREDHTAMRKTLIAEYHTSLARDESLTAEFFARLKTMMRERRLLYGAREIGVALRPHLLTRSQYAILAHASEVLAGAFEKIASALLSEPSRMETVGLTEREIKLALVEPKHSASTVTSRLDAFVHGHEVKFVEYNAENPSSLSTRRVSTRFFSKLAQCETYQSAINCGNSRQRNICSTRCSTPSASGAARARRIWQYWIGMAYRLPTSLSYWKSISPVKECRHSFAHRNNLSTRTENYAVAPSRSTWSTSVSSSTNYLLPATIRIRSYAPTSPAMSAL